jgi:hypothetical protein
MHELLKNAVFSTRFPISRGLLPGATKRHNLVWVIREK